MTYRNFNNESTRSSVLKAVASPENQAAWNRFFDLYAGFVFSIARAKGLSGEDADDVVQNVFADLARDMPTFKYDPAKGRFRSYLIRLVNWRVTDKLRLLKRDAEMKDGYSGEVANRTSVDAGFAEHEWQAAAVEEALRRIKNEVRPDHYAAFVASTMEGQDTETVLRLYNLSRDNLYQIRKRLTALLRETVAQVLSEMDFPQRPTEFMV